MASSICKRTVINVIRKLHGYHDLQVLRIKPHIRITSWTCFPVRFQSSGFHLQKKNSSSILFPGQFATKPYLYGRQFHLSSTFHASKDFYKVLGVSKNSSQKDIKKSYYQLAKKYHPDTNKGDKDASKKFAEVAEAYEVLGDESKRQEYDMLGSAGYQASQQGGGGGHHWGGAQAHGFTGQMNPEDLFKKIFEEFSGGSTPGGGARNPFDEFREYSPLEVHLDLTFNEAAKGVNKTIQVEMMDSCPRCQGAGNEPGSKIARCGYCGGSGMEQISTGPFVMRSTCRKCGGSGKLITHPCVQCNGRGQVKQKKSVTVPVPAGIEDKQTVRMQVGARELFITFRVLPSLIFKRQGADVHSDVDISIFQAALGSTIRIPGVHSDTELVIPAGTNSHRRFHFRGKGIKKVNSYGYGDHYVHVKIQAPSKLSSEQKELLQNIAKDLNENVDGIKYDNDKKKTNPETNNAETKDDSTATNTSQSSEEESRDDKPAGFFGKVKRAIFG